MSEEMKGYDTLDDIRMTLILTLFDKQSGTFSENVPVFNEMYPEHIHDLIREAATDQDIFRTSKFPRRPHIFEMENRTGCIL